MLLDVGGADQREVVLVGDREDDPLVGVLEDVGVVVLEQARHDDVAALDQPQVPRRQRLALAARATPRRKASAHGPGGVDHGARAHGALAPSAPSSTRRPAVGVALRADAARARQDLAPRARASSALSTTSRASSTQPSE